MKNNKKNKTIFVGISGGVDSSVSAAILKKQGYNIVGVFIRTWTPDFIKCTWKDERRDAMRVCANLDIPFLECDAEEAYKKGVADYMIGEYKIGNTPNPDVMCNREIKFGVFWDFAKKRGADFIATGHYAINNKLRINNSSQSTFQELLILRKSKDSDKDQSYFLWTLTQEDLSHTIFPIGHLKKLEVRKLALKYNIPVATKKDSQGVCFLGPLDMKDFLKHYIKSKKGDVLDIKGKIIGYHEGAVFFTLGERHGFHITDNLEQKKPLYVISKNIKNNTITVSHRSDWWGDTNQFENKVIKIKKVNWITTTPKENKSYTAQIRYHGKLLGCKVLATSRTSGKVFFKDNLLVDKGQSIVFYDKDICLGGGIVE